MSYKEFNDWEVNYNIYGWLSIYKKLLKEEESRFPDDFWRENSEKKLQELLRFYIEKENIKKHNIPYMNPKNLIEGAKLDKFVEKDMHGFNELALCVAFENVTLENFRWDGRRDIDLEKAETLRQLYCSIGKVANYFNCDTRELKTKAKEEDIDLTTPEDKSCIEAPALEVVFFWHQIKNVKKGNKYLEEAISTIKEENGWKNSRINKYLCRYNIKTEIGRFRSQSREILDLTDENRKLNDTEKLVCDTIEGDIKALKSCGADFLIDKGIIAEVKESIHKYNIKHAILQTIYGSDILNAQERRIYTKKYDLGKKELSVVRRMLNFYKISIYEYKKRQNCFKEVKYNDVE